MSNVCELLLDALRSGGDRPCLHIARCQEIKNKETQSQGKESSPHISSITFAQLQTNVIKAQQALQVQGIKPGARLLVLADISAHTYAYIVAAVAMGAVVVFPPQMAANGLTSKWQMIRFIRQQSGAFALVASDNRWLNRLVRGLGRQLIVVDQPCLPSNPEPQPADSNLLMIHKPDDISQQPALISFSSGTTGAPKPIVRTHGKLVKQFALMAQYLHRPQSPPTLEQVLADGSLDFTYMGVMALFNLGQGWATLIPSGFDFTHPLHAGQLAELCEQFQPRRITGSATFAQAVLADLKSSHAINSLSSVVLGGAPTDEAALSNIQTLAQHASVRIFYGSTEAEPIAVLNVDKYQPDQYQGTGYLVGKPIAEIEFRLQPQGFVSVHKDDCEFLIGEIWVRGEHVIGHEADAWLNTGDSGYLDENGQLWITGRTKEAITLDNGRLMPTYLLEKPINNLASVARSAVVQSNQKVTIFVEGEGEGDSQAIHKELQKVGLQKADIQTLPVIPLDSRHRCKINRPQLLSLLQETSMSASNSQNEQPKRRFIVDYNLADGLTLAGIGSALIGCQNLLLGDFFTALAWLYLAIFFDGVDGLVARKLDIQREFGRYLDGFADAVTYVAFPLLLLFQLGYFSPVMSGLVGLLFVSAALSRLAKFNEVGNVQAADSLAYLGMPVFWGGLACGPIFMLHGVLASAVMAWLIPLALLAYAICMVLNRVFWKPKSMVLIFASTLLASAGFSLAALLS